MSLLIGRPVDNDAHEPAPDKITIVELLMPIVTSNSENGLRPSRKEIAAYYAAHRAAFFFPERITVGHIIKNIGDSMKREEGLALMEQARQDLASGTAFRIVAERYSDCGLQGEIPWFSRGVMVDEFDDVVFRMEPGETSDIFETRFGFHIVRLLERRPAGIAALGEVYDEICERIRAEGLQKLAVRNR